MITVVTAFAPERLWTIDLWNKVINETVSCQLPMDHAGFVLIDNTLHGDLHDRLRFWDSPKWKVYLREKQIKQVIPKKNPHLISPLLASFWNRASKYIEPDDYVLSLESDVVPDDAAILKLREVLDSNPKAGIVGCPIHSRLTGHHLMVYNLESRNPWKVSRKSIPNPHGVVEVGSVSFGCTLFRGSLLEDFEFTAVTGGALAHEYCLMKHCADVGQKVFCRFDIEVRHYGATPDKWF